jgi:ABC-type multidrug transport system fused ATPase/permease subunit
VRPLARGSSRGLALAARNLSYRYPGADRDALRDVSLTVAAGERVAIVGTEGAGESTLLAVLTGLLPTYEGALTYDGVSARDVDLGEVRAGIAVARSELDLFDGTLEENVSLGRPQVGPAEVLAALDRVQLSELVQALPDGLRTRVGGGTRLPSSVSRKIVLARTLAGRPRLLAFDEFFHHLDPDYKRSAVATVTASDAGWSVLAVSHDPLFLAHCDRIYVLEDGRVTRSGTYDELLEDPYFCGVVRAPFVRAAGAASLAGSAS